jgi:hypothetical protein
MLKIFLCAIAFFVPSLGYGDELKELSAPRRLNLEVRSTNTCSGQQLYAAANQVSPSDQPNAFLYLRDICRDEINANWHKNPIINSEVTTWLKLKSGHSHDTRMIGLGFRFQVADEGVAHIRLRGSGGIQFRYRSTF